MRPDEMSGLIFFATFFFSIIEVIKLFSYNKEDTKMFKTELFEIRSHLLTLCVGDTLQQVYALQYIMDCLDKLDDIYSRLCEEKGLEDDEAYGITTEEESD
jgi:hypothetical protein